MTILQNPTKILQKMVHHLISICRMNSPQRALNSPKQNGIAPNSIEYQRFKSISEFSKTKLEFSKEADGVANFQFSVFCSRFSVLTPENGRLTDCFILKSKYSVPDFCIGIRIGQVSILCIRLRIR